ncbi:VPLPA-CTERM-specific exosortase XrtD [Sinirhodobacter populi]|uniref:VPLPA-CTERM-specific exosortase XrtD n=1 Tax=Paenirhodobacter populi TaxID=2306993 RepID=A0A443KAU8_9RHOB|nr:VPLPA-CTERM-specific exosortase XrtD [Sinirhodobacter populi]RWR29826.1 VPLPA-CTERM-specific exosortase XrtD [Sinirhodobacter populi]
MSDTSLPLSHDTLAGRLAGPFWLLVATVAAAIYFREGLDALLAAWSTPEYSHGPVIPVLSAFMFLHELKAEPIRSGRVNRWPGIFVLLLSVALGALGKFSQIDDVVAYATIIWVGAMLLISFGWDQGKRFWVPVLHLVFMLPLPGVFYYKLSTFLQGVSSELGVWFLNLLNVPVFLDGNIIDLGILKMHVAEACSGLRYLFPIMSFSYVFAVLYKGPWWHKAVLLIAAAPITVLMNSVRIAIAGWLVQYLGESHLEGFQHFFEGWVIFMASVLMLFLLAWMMLKLQDSPMSLTEALDLDFSGLWPQLRRLERVEASKGMIAAALILVAAAAAWQIRPQPAPVPIDRAPFALFPRQLGEWNSYPMDRLSDAVAKSLGADDYYGASFMRGETEPRVEFFSAFYKDQTKGGTHSPEICLPGSGWEIARLQRVDVAPELGLPGSYRLNRAVIQKGEAKMLVYYWFEQHGRHVAWDFEAKMLLLWDGFTIRRTDGALVRLTTPIAPGESEEHAEARLRDMFLNTIKVLPEFVPGLDE